jgi:hypothetical protein
VVLFQLLETDGTVEVRIQSRPRSDDVREALQELAGLLRHVFAAERSPLTPAERERLLGKQNATVGERLLLLTRLAIAPDATVATAPVAFQPRNRGLERYLGKFAALPDGLPFSLRLLLTDQRGRKQPEEESAQQKADAVFLALPEAVLLLAVRKTLRREDPAQVWSDYDIGPELRKTLEEMGLSLDRAPSEEAVRTLRERWARARLPLFPNAPQRRRQRHP